MKQAIEIGTVRDEHREESRRHRPWDPPETNDSGPPSHLSTAGYASGSRRPFSVHSRALKLHVLDLGQLRLDKNFMVANSWFATANNPNPPGQVIDIPVAAYYIEHPDGNVLFDTGCHPDWSGPNARWPENLQEIFPHMGGDECTLPARLDALGLGPDQIQHVVMSHLHCDHAGCIEYFRKSNIIVHEDEFSAAVRHHALRDHSTPFALRDIDKWLHLDLNWREIGRAAPDMNIVDGVRLLNLGSGHSYGMLGLHVELRGHPGVMLVSDACYTAENYGPPMRPSGIAYDSIGFANTMQRIRAIADDTKSTVWFGHDAAQFAAVRKSTEGYFYE